MKISKQYNQIQKKIKNLEFKRQELIKLKNKEFQEWNRIYKLRSMLYNLAINNNLSYRQKKEKAKEKINKVLK